MHVDTKLSHKYYDRHSQFLVVAFNSMGCEKGFEWTKAIGERGHNSLHISCEARSWYHYAIPEVLDLLSHYKPDLLIGSSMGGYAALMFGGLTGLRARVFAPQTTLGPVLWDNRWQYEWKPIRERTPRPDLIDLVELKQHEGTEVYYCTPVIEDRKHANRLKGVNVIARGCERHEEASRDLHRGALD